MEIIIIKRAIIISFIVIAIWATMLPNMIFGKIRDIEMPDWLATPLYDCPICQTPWYGTILYVIFFRQNWVEWILVIGVAMGINTIFVKMKKN